MVDITNSIVTEHDGYTKITYPHKNRIMAHKIWNPEAVNPDHYPWDSITDLDLEVTFDEDMTVKDIGYTNAEPRLNFRTEPEKGRWEVMMFCPECMGIAQTFTDRDFIDRLFADFGLHLQEEIMCKKCGKTYAVDTSDNSITSNYFLKHPVKCNTERWLNALLFSEENADTEGCVSVVLNYAVSGINNVSYKVFNKLGAVRITMNMKTGMTYMLNNKIRGKYPEKNMRVIKDGNILNITYGSEYLRRLYYGKMGMCFDGETVADKLNDPVVVRFFAEAMIRYKGIKKESLTKTGDFSDTSFWRLCALNCIPEASVYADVLEEMTRCVQERAEAGYSDWYAGPDPIPAVRRCLKDIRRTFKKSPEYTESLYMNRKIPKSIRKMIAEDPTDYYVYKTLRKMGFRNTDIIRMVMNGTDLTEKITILSMKENCNTVHGYGDRKNVFTFIKDMTACFGEKKTARIVKSMLGSGENIGIFSDTVVMYSSIAPENRVLKGKTIKEIHDALLPEYHKAKVKNIRFTYTKREEKLADVIDDTEFFLPKDQYELTDASVRLHNCVKGYGQAILLKSSTIVLMKRKNKLVGCIELKGKRVVQAYAPCNIYFSAKDNDIFTKWCSNHGLTGSANGWEEKRPA